MTFAPILLGLAVSAVPAGNVDPGTARIWGGRYILDHGSFELLKFNREEFARPFIDQQGSYFYLGLRSERFEAREIGSGRLVWSKPDFGEVGAEMAEHDGRILVGVGAGLAAMDKYDGEEAWRIDLGGTVAGPMAVIGDRAVIPVRPNAFVAVDLADGVLLWRQKRPTPEDLTVRGQAGPWIDPSGQRVVLGFSDGSVMAARIDSGEPIWVRRLAEPAQPFQDVDTTPIGCDGGRAVLIAAYNHGVFKLSVETGAVLYERLLVGIHGQAQLDDGTVVLSSGQEAIGFDSAEGKVSWRFRVAKGSTADPVPAGKGQVWIGSSEGALTLLDGAKGRPLQVLSTGSGMSTPMFVRGEEAVLLSNEAMVLVLGRGRGTRISGRLPLDRPLVPFPDSIGGSLRSW
ncbi:MAG: PQQ-binding-like beta-propeller repeat protein [Myxococcota bacterium]